MKKSTFILSLLLAFLGVTATAQTFTGKALSAAPNPANSLTSVAEISSSNYYVLYNPGRNRYITLNPADRLLAATQTLAVDRTSMLAIFQIESIEEDDQTYYTFKVASSPAGQGYYIPVLNDGGKHYASTNAEKFSISVSDETNHYLEIKGKSNNKYFNCNDDTFTGWYQNGGNGNYKIIPVERGSETYSNYAVSYSIKVGEEVKESNTSRGWGGDTFGSVPYSYYYAEPTLVSGSNVIGEGNTNFVYTTTFKEGEAGTVPVSFSTASNNTWYSLQIMNDGTRTVKAIKEDNTWHVNTVVSAFNKTDLGDYNGFNNAIWAFVESGTGVKLYNKGTDKYLKWTSGFATLEAADNATTFYITENPTNGRTNCFSLWTGDGNKYLNASERKGGVANARLGVWDAAGSATDAGSRFLFWSVDEANSNLVNVGKDCINNITPNEADANYVTAGLAADIDNAKTAAAAASVTNLDALDAIVAKLNYPGVDLDANAYYRIANINISKKYASTENIPTDTEGSLQGAYNADNSIDRVVRRVESTGAFVPMLWQVLPNDDGTVKIKNANNGKYWASGNGAAVDMPINDASAFNYTLTVRPGVSISNGKTNDGKTMFQILTSGHMINAHGGDGSNILQSFDNISDAGGYWQLEKVTSVPVSISEALYASVGFPFAVQVPTESGVKAYYATAAADGELTLSEIADGIIPAYTGAILAATKATNVNLTIVTTEKTLDNKLVAATAKRTGFEANANYMLGVDSDSEVKFLQATINTVPANKAYLPAANVTNSRSALAFNFGGESTGIATSLKDNEEVQYFDLNGRVVLYPSNGVFITNTGKKVFIK